MQPLPDLLQAEPENFIDNQPTPRSYSVYDYDEDVVEESGSESESESGGLGSKVVFSMLFILLAGAIGGISYYGIGPMLAPPKHDVAVNSSAPNVADVLGLSSSQPELDDTLTEAQKQTYAQQLAQLIELPAEEELLVFRVATPPGASDGTFFADAQSGDILFIFKNAGLAHLLRPDENRIVSSGEIAPASN